jgi:hypothetical protein
MVATKPEGQAVAALVWAALAADTGAGGVSTLLGGRIYRDRVPQSAALPAAVIDSVRWVPLNTMNGRRVAVQGYLSVHFIGDGSDYGSINPAAARADVVVHGLAGANGGVTAVKLENVGPDTAYTEDDAGKVYVHITMDYRTPAYQTP